MLNWDQRYCFALQEMTVGLEHAGFFQRASSLINHSGSLACSKKYHRGLDHTRIGDTQNQT